MHADEVLWIIRGHQRRLEQQDDLLAHLARNIAMPPRRSKKRLHTDLKKWKFYGADPKPDELPEGDDDPDKVIVLEKRRREMEELAERYGPPKRRKSPRNRKGS